MKLQIQNCRENLDCRSPEKAIGKPRSRQKDSGQIVVEYVLLLVVAVSLAALITRTLISQSGGNGGFLITVWQQVTAAIGADKADDTKDSGVGK